MRTIDYANKALAEAERNNDDWAMRYWAAYLDGARAVMREQAVIKEGAE